jgi:hypothetical protein
MECSDDLRARILARPSPEEIDRRQRAAEEVRRLQVSIAPVTVTDLRRLAREEEEATYDHGRGMDP